MHNLLNQIWAIDISYVNSVLPHLDAHLRKVKKKGMKHYMGMLESLMFMQDGHPTVDMTELSPISLALDTNLGMPVAKTPQGDVAIIPVTGPLTKYGDLCNMGMQGYQSMLNRANQPNNNIVGSVLVIDSPGGTVDGTPEFGLAVKNSPKPVGVFGDGLVASAAYWVASQANVIVGNKNNPTKFGSIGTLAMKQDYTNMMDANRMQKVEIIRAPQSTDKALVNSFEPMSEDVRTGLVSELSDVTNQFIDTVKSGRGDALDTTTQGLFTGDTFGVYDAKKAGMIDSVGTLQTAVNKVAELAKQKRLNSNQNNQANMNILEFLGLSKEAKAKLSAEDQAKLDELETKFNSMESALSTVKAENGTLTKQVSDLNATVAAHVNTIAAKDKEISDLTAKLSETPAGHATTVVGAGDDKLEKAGLEKYQTSVDAEAEALKKMSNTQFQFK